MKDKKIDQHVQTIATTGDNATERVDVDCLFEGEEAEGSEESCIAEQSEALKRLKRLVERQKSSLNTKELNVLRLRFGLDDPGYDKATQDRIKEIELKALKKLSIIGNTHGQK